MFRSGESDSDAEELEHADKLRQVKAVLEEVVCLDNLIDTFLFSELYPLCSPLSFYWIYPYNELHSSSYSYILLFLEGCLELNFPCKLRLMLIIYRCVKRAGWTFLWHIQEGSTEAAEMGESTKK